jgi:starvation-inducible outer membrane lipoprotein
MPQRPLRLTILALLFGALLAACGTAPSTVIDVSATAQAAATQAVSAGQTAVGNIRPTPQATRETTSTPTVLPK